MQAKDVIGLFLALRLTCHFIKWTGKWGEDFEARLLARPTDRSGFIDVYIHEEPEALYAEIYNVKAHNLIHGPRAVHSSAEIRDIVYFLLKKHSTNRVVVRIGEYDQ